MKVHFLVPGTAEHPSGGVRIIYEHANRLAQRGHQVVLHHLLHFPGDRHRSLLRHAMHFARRYTLYSRFPDWFDFSAGVELRYALFAKPPNIEQGDKIVATYWKTHELLTAEQLSSGNCFYFIQGLETWLVDQDKLHSHWESPSKNIVVSRWISRIMADYSISVAIIPNAIDHEFFRQIDDIERENKSILFCSMRSSNKGSKDIIDALNRLYKSGNKYTIASFGNVDPGEHGLIAPCEHHQTPSQATIRELYNRASIFVAASYSEGWGLTLAEATACGAALIVSDADGHFEFARPGRSAMFFRRGDSNRMMHKIRFLADRPGLQEAMVRNAQADLAPFNWDNASRKFEAVLLGDD